MMKYRGLGISLGFSQTPHQFFIDLFNRLLGRVRSKAIPVLRNINIEIRKGEVFGLLGPNGAGKTTLIRVLSGLLMPDEGTAIVLGHDVRFERRQVLKLVNLVPNILTGSVWCDPSLSARRNLKLIADLLKVPRRRVDEVLRFVGLYDVADRRIATYSSGMAARLIAAYGLLREAPIYLMDEPTLGISAEAAREFHLHLKEYIQGELGATVVYATNDVYEAEKICDRVAILYKGRVVACGEPRELVKSLGEGKIIELHISPEAPEKFVASLHEISGIEELRTRVKETNGLAPKTYIIWMRVREVEDVLPDVVRIAVKKYGLEVRRVEVHKPTLEDAFVKYVGGDRFEGKL